MESIHVVLGEPVPEVAASLSTPLIVAILAASFTMVTIGLWGLHTMWQRRTRDQLRRTAKTRRPVADLDAFMRQRSAYAIRRTYSNPLRSPEMVSVLAMGGDSLPEAQPQEPAPRLFLVTKRSPPSQSENILGLAVGQVLTYFDCDGDWYWGQLNGVDGWFDPTCVREITAKQQQQLLKQKPALQPEGQTSSRAHNHTSVRTVKQRGATDAAAALKRAAAAAAGVGRSARQEVPPADVLRALTPDMPPMPAHLSTMSLDLSNLVSFNNLSAADLASAVGEWNEPQTEAKADTAARAAAERRRVAQQIAAGLAVQHTRQGRVALMSKVDNRTTLSPPAQPPSLPDRAYTTNAGRNSNLKPQISNGAGGTRKAVYL